MEKLLEAEGLYKILEGEHILRGCTFSLRPGSVTGLLGPNGAGKSTLLKVLAGVWRADWGAIRLKGEPVARRDRPRIAYMADHSLLPQDLTARRAVRWYQSLFPGLDRDRLWAMAGELPLDRKVCALTKGQAERLDLALLLARDADVYLLDEPLGGVDPVERAAVLAEAAGVAEGNKALLIATHLVHDAEPILDDVLFLSRGHVVYSGSAEDLRQREGLSVKEKYMDVFGGGRG